MGRDNTGENILYQDYQRELANSIMRRDSMDHIRILLASGSKADKPVSNGLKPLHYAVYEQYEEAVRLLLVRGSDANTTDSGGYTAMHLCAERGYLNMMKILVEFGGKVSCLDPTVTDLFPSEDMEEPLRLAIKGGHCDCAEFLLDNGANPNARYFLGGEINMVHPEDFVFTELLLRYGAKPDSFDRSGLTPLMKACKYKKCLDTVKLLVHYGADVNSQATARQDFRTVLHYAVMGDNIEAAIYLLKHGAQVNMEPDYEGPSPLDVAILTDDLEMVKVLVEAGANVSSFTSTIGTPLHIVLGTELKHQCEIIEYLLEKGANVNKIHRYHNGAVLKSPLVEYLNSNKTYNRMVLSLLLRYGARVIFIQPALDARGVLRSLQHIIPEDGSEEMLELLVYSSDSVDLFNVQKSMLIPEEVREPLLRMSLSPSPLRHQARMRLRDMFPEGKDYVKKVKSLPFPDLWIRYLLFEFC